ncbi:MAG: hypothetical protein HFI86_00910 [Bacilli bacterium]|nr:hypothetical protein [Bacilli bacterium]
MDGVALTIITLVVVAIILIVVVLNVMQSSKNKKMKKLINNLEIQKNVLDSTPIIPELAKVESYLKSEKMEVMYNDWKERLENIKNIQIPKITDMIIEAEYSLSQMDYKATLYKIAKLEMEIYKVRTNSEFLLNEIKDITNSEEKNRAIITKLKAKYREIYQKFTNEKESYDDYEKIVFKQFEIIAKSFEKFELIMENNDYTEVSELVRTISDMLKHMEVIVSEMPSVILLATSILPKKIVEIGETYKQLSSKGFPLDYLNVEYNIDEAYKKIDDILARAEKLDLEDSLLELKVLHDYFENLFNDFEKEKVTKNVYDEANEKLQNKLSKINELLTEIFSSIDDVKNLYDLSDENIEELNNIKKDFDALNEDYNVLIQHTNNNTFAYSKLTKEIESLILRLANLETRLDGVLDQIGSMREDEVRARQQLEEIRLILKDSKNYLRQYSLPIIPKSYFVELSEAQSAIKEIVKELAKKPITIDVLNTRVDTARDLVLKIYGRTKEMIKTAKFAEMAIVYGNRYRSNTDELDKRLTCSELLFNKGDYKKSLELTIETLNKVEPDIYNKLSNLYEIER